MASKKVYYTDKGETELEIFRNTMGYLIITLSPFPQTHSSDVTIMLPRIDAINIIKDLADDFGIEVKLKTSPKD